MCSADNASMPHELALENIELFGRSVGLRPVWERRGWVNHWWPERCGACQRRWPAAAARISGRGRHLEARARSGAPPSSQDRVLIRLSKGAGRRWSSSTPLGLTWDPFLDELAQHFTVHDPKHPARRRTSRRRLSSRRALGPRALLRRVMTALRIKSAVMVRHSFGHVACEWRRPTGSHRRQGLIAPSASGRSQSHRELDRCWGPATSPPQLSRSRMRCAAPDVSALGRQTRPGRRRPRPDVWPWDTTANSSGPFPQG